MNQVIAFGLARSYRAIATLSLVQLVACGSDERGLADGARPLEALAWQADEPAANLDSTCAGEPAGDASIDQPAKEVSVRELLDWVLATLTDGHSITHDEVEQHFAPEFLLDVPEPELVAAFAQLHDQLGEFSLAEVEQTGPQALRALLDTASSRWSVDIQASTTSPREIVLLYLRPIAAAPAFASYGEASEALQTSAAESQLLVAEIKDGACVPIETRNETAQLAIGSAFKLWVLLALDHKLHAEPGLAWENTLTIRDELKSLPSGVLQDEPAGTELTLREFAAKMISISDNTATDHLIDFVGRDAVERAQLDTQHTAPEANIPWLNTRELFSLKLAATPDQVDAYRNASPDEKRGLLEQLRSLPIEPDAVAAWRAPRMLDLEWFANASDLCAALSTLAGRVEFEPDSELLRILSINPGVNFDPAAWTYVGYKGGSEPGVLNLSWLLRRVDGRWFSVVITLNDALELVNEARAVEVAAGIAQLLALES